MYQTSAFLTMFEWVWKSSETNTEEEVQSKCLPQQHDDDTPTNDASVVAMLRQILALKASCYMKDDDDAAAAAVIGAVASFDSVDNESIESNDNDEKAKQYEDGLYKSQDLGISLISLTIVDVTVATLLAILAGALLFVPLLVVLLVQSYSLLGAPLLSKSIRLLLGFIFACYNHVQWMFQHLEQCIRYQLSPPGIVEEEITFAQRSNPIHLSVDQANELLYRAMYDEKYHQTPSRCVCASFWPRNIDVSAVHHHNHSNVDDGHFLKNCSY